MTAMSKEDFLAALGTRGVGRFITIDGVRFTDELIQDLGCLLDGERAQALYDYYIEHRQDR